MCNKKIVTDENEMLNSMKLGQLSLGYASKELRSNKDFVLKALQISGDGLEYVSEELKSDREVVLCAVRDSFFSYRYASKELRNDQEVLLEVIKKNSSVWDLDFFGEKIKDDKEFVIKALMCNIRILIYLSDELKNDKEVLYAIKDELKRNKERYSKEYENLKKYEREDELLGIFNEKRCVEKNVKRKNIKV